MAYFETLLSAIQNCMRFLLLSWKLQKYITFSIGNGLSIRGVLDVIMQFSLYVAIQYLSHNLAIWVLSLPMKSCMGVYVCPSVRLSGH